MDSGYGLKNNRGKGIKFTLHHYAKTIYQKAETFNKIFPLAPYFDEMIGDKKEVSIADIGSGMFSTTGSVKEGVKVTIYPCDELADEFRALQDKFNIKPVIPIIKQDMESLTYPDNFFDIVHCVNALDHCENPYKAISEMIRVCKSGGYVYLCHFSNTAELQKYWGEHKWNITFTINSDCVFWSKTGGFLLSSDFSGFKNTLTKELSYGKYKMIVSILKK